jgi:hypothetical protein
MFGDLAIGHALGSCGEHGSDPLDLGRHRFEDRRLAGSDVAVWRLTTGLAQAAALGGQTLGYAAPQLAAVGLGLVGFADEVVPAIGIGGDDPLIGEQDGYSCGVEVIHSNEGLLEVPLEPAHIADQEQVVSARPRSLGHGRELRCLVYGPPRCRALPGEAGIDQAIPLDDPVLKLPLGVGAPVVVLARGGLADPAGYP